MVLIELKGVVKKKMLASGAYTLAQLQRCVAANNNEKRSYVLFVIGRDGKSKICDLSRPIKEYHEMYKNDEGYLKIEVKFESAFWSDLICQFYVCFFSSKIYYL